MTRLLLLAAYGSPISTAYLKVLRARKDIDLVCAYERNEKVAADIARIFQERFGEKAPRFEPASSLGIKEVMVSGFHTPEGLQALHQLQPDLMILGGAGIIKDAVLAVPKGGTINCHPGILPRYRGCTCLEWAIYEDQPVGVTCHFVTHEIDAGPILLRETMAVAAGQTYLDVRLSMFYFQADFLGRAVHKWIQSGKPYEAAAEPFDWNQAHYYKPIPPDEMKEVHRKLDAHEYTCAAVTL